MKRRTWSAEKVAHVMSMRGVKTAAELGEELGVSRNAICGLWKREVDRIRRGAASRPPRGSKGGRRALGYRPCEEGIEAAALASAMLQEAKVRLLLGRL